MHLRDEVPSGAGRAAIGGRVEHVVSGRSVEFASLAELGEFMRRMAGRADRGPTVSPLAPSPPSAGHPGAPEAW
jgi:hypothetical protein